MTTTHPTPPVEHAADPGDVWQPRGRPVRWAVAIVGTIAVLSLVSIWFGAVAPWVDTSVSGWGTESGPTIQAQVTFDLTNNGHAPVRLRSAGRSLPGLRLVSAVVPVTLDAGETVSITLRYEVTDCGKVPAEAPPIPLKLRTPLGLTRTVDGPRNLGTDSLGAPLPWAQALLGNAC